MIVEELERDIAYYAQQYYLGNPLITDEQFDALVDKLRELNPLSRVLTTGWGFEVQGDKIKHKYTHIGSLDKCKSFEDIPDIFKYKKIYISPKLDGLSAVVYYNKGKLVKAVTRGNGEYGKDITDKLKIILGDSISDPSFTGAVRGELIISNSNWELLKQKYTDLIAPRNFAAGIINRKNIDEDIKYIDLVVYKIVGQEPNQTFFNRSDVLEWLQNHFEHVVPVYYYPELNYESWERYHDSTFSDFKNLGYGLDGLVLTDANIQYNVQTNAYLYTEIAFKFQAESTTTIIKDIDWTLSRTQRLVPVANVEPVELSGAIVCNATCNNAKQVLDWGLGKGAEIEICRSNEVIPFIMTVLQPSDDGLPEFCPVCGSKLAWEGVDLKCVNSNCANIDASDLQQWCEVIGETDGLQYTIMKQYLDIYNISNLSDLYTKASYVMNNLNSRQLTITEQKIKQFFEKLYISPVNAEKALLALNIPRLGEKTAQLLAKNKSVILSLFYYCLDRDIADPTNQLLDLVKDATTAALLSNKQKISHLKYLFSDDFNSSRLVFQEVDNNMLTKYIAVTGALESMKRKDFEEFIKKFGYELSTNIKKCEYLVNNDINSTSTKNKQAKDLGVTIITEQEFLSKLSNL